MNKKSEFQDAIDKIDKCLRYNEIKPDLQGLSADGSYMFEFLLDGNYFLIEVWKDCDLVFFKRDAEGNRFAYDVDMAQLFSFIDSEIVELSEKLTQADLASKFKVGDELRYPGRDGIYIIEEGLASAYCGDYDYWGCSIDTPCFIESSEFYLCEKIGDDNEEN